MIYFHFQLVTTNEKLELQLKNLNTSGNGSTTGDNIEERKTLHTHSDQSSSVLPSDSAFDIDERKSSATNDKTHLEQQNASRSLESDESEVLSLDGGSATFRKHSISKQEPSFDENSSSETTGKNYNYE